MTIEFLRFSSLGPDLWAVSGDGQIATFTIGVGEQPSTVTPTRTLTESERRGIDAFVFLKGGPAGLRDRLQ
jgi:hypothetical protein